MPDEILLLVKRAEGCECLVSDGGLIATPYDPVDGFALDPCPHSSTIEVLPAQVVECERCGGTGDGEDAIDETDTGDLVFVKCPDCLGTGKRLAPKE